MKPLDQFFIFTNRPLVIIFFLMGTFHLSTEAVSQEQSIARQWNEVLLEAIRNDFARPTVHARNLFHSSMAMYDAWAAYDSIALPLFLGNELGGYPCTFEGVPVPEDIQAAREEAISYAMYQLVKARFLFAPDKDVVFELADSLMTELGYDLGFTDMDYSTGQPAALGNYIARCIIDFGVQDGSNEFDQYENQFYEPSNEPLIMDFAGNPDIGDPNRWQPLTLEVFIDQSGNVIPGRTPDFLSPEWGQVFPFALKDEDLTIYQRDGFDYWVFHDPGPPPMIDTLNGGAMTEEYKWSFNLVSVWSSHLDPSDSVMWDISPGSIGNIQDYPETFEEHPDFYNLIDGGDPGEGWDVNPYTGEAYEPQMVPRGDYARVLAEFWADGPDSETPPGHWFTILNYVSDHPLVVKKFEGTGEELDDLEWDIKSYLILGGAMHDVAISVWGIKGWYDYIRPVSALRYLADQGQSTDPGLPSYSPNGITLIDGFVELINEGDALAGVNDKHVGKIKIKAWKGPDYIQDPDSDVAEVDWILGEEWWPYQRPSFVTPPFAGYISGHSTYSSAAAEILTRLTGDPFFPGGLGEFACPQNEFLVFEDGPSVSLTLQWATYKDAADQCSLSRIWGGIHPPADDIPGRLIGPIIGGDAFDKAKSLFGTTTTSLDEQVFVKSGIVVYPNPVYRGSHISLDTGKLGNVIDAELFDLLGKLVYRKHNDLGITDIDFSSDVPHPGPYFLVLKGEDWQTSKKILVVD